MLPIIPVRYFRTFFREKIRRLFSDFFRLHRNINLIFPNSAAVAVSVVATFVAATVVATVAVVAAASVAVVVVVATFVVVVATVAVIVVAAVTAVVSFEATCCRDICFS